MVKKPPPLHRNTTPPPPAREGERNMSLVLEGVSKVVNGQTPIHRQILELAVQAR